MSDRPINILLVEDSPSDAELLQESLRASRPGQFEFTHVETLTEGLARLTPGQFQVVLLDLSLPDTAGPETYLRARAAAPHMPIVVLTGANDEAIGVDAVRQGIQDYLLKGEANGAQTARTIRYAIERHRAETELRRARDELETRVIERTADLRETVELLQKEMHQRKEVELALRESEERYRALFEAAPMGIAISNYKGEVLAFNRSLCALGGVTPEEARALQTENFHALPGQGARLLAQLRKKGRVEKSEALLRRKDGSTFPGLLSIEEVRVGKEKVLMTIVQDITNQKQHERHVNGIRELLELFATKTTRQDYVEAVTGFLRDWSGCQCAGIRIVDGKQRIPYAAALGYNREFLNQENCLTLDTMDCPCGRFFLDRRLGSDAQFDSRQGSFFCDATSRFAQQFCKDPAKGRRLACVQAGYESLAHTPIRYQGQLLGTIHLADAREGMVPQATVFFIESVAPLIGEAFHRFHVEESLVESEQRFRSMFERHDAPMLLVDPDSGAIEDANPAAAMFYGYFRPRLRTMNRDDLHALPPRVAAGLRERARQEGQNYIVVPHRLANGDVRTVEVHSSPVQVKGRQLLFSIIHDVTERKLLEKEILDIGETERQRIGQDLHDSLGGMLTGVALMSKALARQLEAKGIAEAATAGEIVSCINNAITLTRTISRGLFPEELSAAGLVEGLREFAGETAKRSGIACNFEASKGALIHDQSVAAHLFRIAQEAVNNALRHSEASQVKIRLARSGGQILLEVRDDGKGMPAREPKDRGLGLRTMKYRADIIGAQFAIKPGDPRGTVISCQLAPDAALPPKSGKC